MRAFFAFETSPEVVRNLLSMEEELRATRVDVKLVEEGNLHFTVKFLGEIPETAVPEIDRRIGALAISRMEEVTVRGLGAFPDARRPRVVWAGLAPEDEQEVSRSAQRIIDALEGVGQEEDASRRPPPHHGREGPLAQEPAGAHGRDPGQFAKGLWEEPPGRPETKVEHTDSERSDL
jgi:2'-5' RNA ligase